MNNPQPELQPAFAPLPQERTTEEKFVDIACSYLPSVSEDVTFVGNLTMREGGLAEHEIYCEIEGLEPLNDRIADLACAIWRSEEDTTKNPDADLDVRATLVSVDQLEPSEVPVELISGGWLVEPSNVGITAYNDTYMYEFSSFVLA